MYSMFFCWDENLVVVKGQGVLKNKHTLTVVIIGKSLCSWKLIGRQEWAIQNTVNDAHNIWNRGSISWHN